MIFPTGLAWIYRRLKNKILHKSYRRNTLRMNNAVFLMALVMFCSGCAYSVKRLTQDDDLRHRVIKECLAKGIESKDDQNCVNAAEAQMRVSGEKIKGLFE
jgi:hypothetical protein